MVCRDKRPLNPKPPQETTQRVPPPERKRSRNEAPSDPGNPAVIPLAPVSENALGMVEGTRTQSMLLFPNSFRRRNEC